MRRERHARGENKIRCARRMNGYIPVSHITCNAPSTIALFIPQISKLSNIKLIGKKNLPVHPSFDDDIAHTIRPAVAS